MIGIHPQTPPRITFYTTSCAATIPASQQSPDFHGKDIGISPIDVKLAAKRNSSFVTCSNVLIA
jgi:hypothetical protein